MRLVIVGTREDTAGFALAGVESHEKLENVDEETLVILIRGDDADTWESCLGRRRDS